MFGGNKRKYSAVPTANDAENGSLAISSAPRRGRRGGVQQMRKYLVLTLAGITCVVLLMAGRKAHKTYNNYMHPGIGSQGDPDALAILDGEDLIDEYLGLEGEQASEGEVEWAEEDYSSPPFNPEGSGYDPMNDNAYQPESSSDFENNDDEGSEEEETFHILPIPGHEHKTKPAFAEIDGEEQDDYADASSSSLPTSFETDPDPSSTTACEQSYHSDGALVQYAITIDAGSTGSRVHVYKFNNCGPSPSLEYETFKALQPGLSSFARDPTAAAASLDPLLEEAVRVIPKHLHSCTPIEVKATAGLRLLPGKEGQAILEEVRVRLESDWPFSLGKEDSAVEVMDGKDEGVYAWITANYLLGKIGAAADGSDTMAVMDLGGASTQIVFEPTFPEDSPDTLAEGDHKYQLTFAGRDYTLYQHSYLGYGLMRARRSVHNLIAFTWSFLQPAGSQDIDWDELSEDASIPNPCLSRGTSRQVLLDPPGRNAVNVTMSGVESSFEACNRVVELVMAKDAVCEVKPCSFNGVYQPSLLDTFPTGQLLALSYFTDRIQPLLPAFGSINDDFQSLEVETLELMAREVCEGKETWQSRWGDDEEAMAELEDRPEYCLDLTFMHALLRLGYELQPNRELVIEKKLNGVELGWALGAGIAMVEKSTLTCTA